MNLLYYSEENSPLNNTSVCSIMTYTSDLSNGMARYCLFMSQTKVFWLSLGAYVFLCCMLCVWVLCSILMMSCTSVLCALSVPKGKREQSIFHHRQKIFPTASTAVLWWEYFLFLLNNPTINNHLKRVWFIYHLPSSTLIIGLLILGMKWKTNVAILATLLLLGENSPY